MKFFILLGILTTQITFATTGTERSPELPTNMAALGDSITAGAVANFNRSESADNIFLIKFFLTLVEYGFETSIAAFEERHLSWATGWSRKVTSHSRRINGLLKASGSNRTVNTFNAAESGASSFSLSNQVDRVLAWSGAQAPAYVVLDIGANDACVDTVDEMNSAADYSQNVEAALDRLLAVGPNTRVMIGGIPNADHLRTAAKDSTVTGLPLIKTCQDMWNVHGACKNLLQETDQNLRAKVVERFNEYMHELETVTARLNQKWGEDHVRFAPALYDYAFTDNDISVDCFHPNVSGQQIISDLLWQQSWWQP